MLKEVTTQHDTTDQCFLGSITALLDNCVQTWNVDLEVYGKVVNFKIDTAADTTVMSTNTYQNLSRQPSLKPCNAHLMSPGRKLDCKGNFIAETTYKGEMFKLRIYVIRGKGVNNLLGHGAADRLGLMKRVEVVHADTFGGVGLVN